jgi:malonyl-CoA O-methyltransferase
MTMTEAREPVPATAARPVDARALARARRRLEAASTPPWLHGEVARRMADRLPIVKLQPAAVLDWSGRAGASAPLLREAYPQARHWLVAQLPAGPVATAPWWSPRRWQPPAVTQLGDADIPAGAAQLLWSNMALHLESHPQALMARWHRATAVDGFLMFSTLGPGSLAQLQGLYASEGWSRPSAPFVDMHDLGDMLIEAGFADPVMDQETITLTWATAQALVDELHGLGANADPQRFAGLRTPRWRARLLQALQARADGKGRIALDFEIVYGHAFRPLPRPRVAGRTVVPVDDLRQMARAGRRRV